MIPKSAWYSIGGALAALALIMIVYQSGKSAGEDSVRAEWRAAERQYANAAAAILEQHRETERLWSQRLQETTDELYARLSAVEADANDTIAGLRTGNLQLRERFRACSTATARVPDAATPASVDHDAGTGGLSQPDAQFLVRLAARADRAVSQLSACQAYVRSITEPGN